MRERPCTRRNENGAAALSCCSAPKGPEHASPDIEQVREEASRMPDPDATADRAAVVASIMKEGRSSVAIEKPAPDLTRMSDREFAGYEEEIGL